MEKLLIWGAIAFGVYYLLFRDEESAQPPPLGQYDRPRWGYQKNLDEWQRGVVPPGSPPIRPRGGGFREGTRWMYQ